MTHHPNPTLILASSSVYRQQLLERLRYPFMAISPQVDETPQPGEVPARLAQRLALAKARAVAALHPDAVVIGSDQVADLQGQPLGKPGNHAKAVDQLTQMSGQTVVFQTAVAVVCHSIGFVAQDMASVNVTFRTLSADQIENYLRAETPYDCAGSAKSEGLGIALIERIENDDPTALIGLPLIRTCQMISQAGIALLRSR